MEILTCFIDFLSTLMSITLWNPSSLHYYQALSYWAFATAWKETPLRGKGRITSFCSTWGDFKQFCSKSGNIIMVSSGNTNPLHLNLITSFCVSWCCFFKRLVVVLLSLCPESHFLWETDLSSWYSKVRSGTLLEKGYSISILQPSAHATKRIKSINIYLMFAIF